MHEGKYRWMAKAKTFEQLIKNSTLWYLDSGCSRHMTGDSTIFSTFSSYYGGSVTFGDNEKGKIMGKC